MVETMKNWASRAEISERLPFIFRSISRTPLLGLVIFISILVVACMDLDARIGRRPDTNVLEQSLQFGKSTPNDVLKVLGAPYGTGRVMFPTDPSPKTLWSYYYEESTSKDARRIFLFVTFDENKYDGYMWFSSLPSGPTFSK